MVLELLKGCIVDINGNINDFYYSIIKYDNDMLDDYVENKGRGEYNFLDEYFTIDEETNKEYYYRIFGWKNGDKLNKSEIIEEFDTYGDLIIICIDENNEPVDVDELDLDEIIPRNLSDFDDNDSHLDSDNEYDFMSDFIINDMES